MTCLIVAFIKHFFLLHGIFFSTVNPVPDKSKWRKEGMKDGQWSDWAPWSECHIGRCGNETVTRTRTCTSPSPSNGGRNCLGDSYQCKSCRKKPGMTSWLFGLYFL